MIIVIITISLLALFIASAIIYQKKTHCWAEDNWLLVGVGIAAILSFIEVVIIISVNNDIAKSELGIKYETKVLELRSNREVLEEQISRDEFSLKDYDIVSKVIEYNKEVSEFITDIAKHQVANKSLWTNWFVNDIYETFDISPDWYISID